MSLKDLKNHKFGSTELILLLCIIVPLSLYFHFTADNNQSSSSSSSTPSTSWQTSDNSSLAYIAMEEHVKRQLRTPSTAEFPSHREKQSHTTKRGNNTYVINSWVDAENAFGAQVRTRFIGEIEQTGQRSFRLISLELDP